MYLSASFKPTIHETGLNQIIPFYVSSSMTANYHVHTLITARDRREHACDNIHHAYLQHKHDVKANAATSNDQCTSE